MLYKVIPAIDTSCPTELVKRMLPAADCRIIKINYEIALEGLDIVKVCKGFGHEVFLDLKLFDIPATMDRVCRRLNHHNVDYVTVHGAAPLSSIEAAVNAFDGRVLVVCGLTSFATKTSEVLDCALAASMAKAYGVICNVHQIADIKRQYPGLKGFCPGIRLKDVANDDQKVTGDPDYAFNNGADYIICGRSFNDVVQHYS